MTKVSITLTVILITTAFSIPLVRADHFYKGAREARKEWMENEREFHKHAHELEREERKRWEEMNRDERKHQKEMDHELRKRN